MKILNFSYFKEKDNVNKDYKLIVLKELPDQYEGIELNTLSKEEEDKIKEVFKEFEDKLQPFMKVYRRFNKKNITKMYE